MSTLRVRGEFASRPHFATFTVKNWYYLFDRHNRFQILEDCFVYCQKHKKFEVYAFVFMLNHLHFIGSAPNLIAVIRDMKTFLAKELKKNIIATEPNILQLFEKNGKSAFWKNTNSPKMIESTKFLNQKIEYIHYNPVRKQYVLAPEDWLWSSVSKQPTKIEISAAGL